MSPATASSLAGRFHERHEIALHPNFQHTGTYDEVWDALLKLYPAAKGWRSHNGVTGWPITSGGAERGLRYEVYPAVFQNYVAPCQVNRALKGHYVFTTAFWDSHMLHEPEFSWSAYDLPHRKLFEDESTVVVLGFIRTPFTTTCGRTRSTMHESPPTTRWTERIPSAIIAPPAR